MSKYPNLPGVDVKLADGGLVVSQGQNGPRLLIIAPAKTANVPEEPVLIQQESELALYGFGSIFVNGEVNPVAAEWRLAQQSGVRQIFVLAVKASTKKEAFLELYRNLFGMLVDFEVDHVVLSGFSIEDEAEVVATDFEDPEDKEAFPSVPGVIKYGHVVKATDVPALPLTITVGTNDTFTIVDKSTGAVDKVITLSAKVYDGTDGKTLQNLADALTTQLNTAVVGMKAVVIEGRIVIVSKTKFAIKAGTGLATALKLPIATDSVKEESIAGDVIVGHFAKLIAGYAEYQSLGNNATIAYMGTPALSGQATLTSVRTHASRLLGLNTKFNGFLQIVGQEVGIQLPGGITHYMNGATAYAGLVMGLAPQSAPTNKAIPGPVGLRYQYGASQRNALTGNRIVTFFVKNGQVIVTDGITSAPKILIGNKLVDSDYTRLSTMRITNYIAQEVRDVCEPFIGEPNEMPQYNAMYAAIKGRLEMAVNMRVIRDARFSVVPGRDLGSAVVKLKVLPQFETRHIDVDIALASIESF